MLIVCLSEDLYYDKIFYFYVQFVQKFFNEWMVSFMNVFFTDLNDHIIFTFNYFNSAFMCWVIFHLRNVFHLNTVYDTSNVLPNSFFYNLKNFCIRRLGKIAKRTRDMFWIIKKTQLQSLAPQRPNHVLLGVTSKDEFGVAEYDPYTKLK